MTIFIYGIPIFSVRPTEIQFFISTLLFFGTNRYPCRVWIIFCYYHLFLCGNCMDRYNNYWRYLRMSISESEKSFRKNRSIKNVYIHKINSLLKVMGESQSFVPFLQPNFNLRSKSRKSIYFEDHQQLLFQRKQNNKDAAKKARLRKKMYLQLLEQAVANLQNLNQMGKQLEQSSNMILKTLEGDKQIKQEDQIGQYIMEERTQKMRKDESKATMDSEKGCQLNKIVEQIEQLTFSLGWSPNKLPNQTENAQNFYSVSRISEIQEQLLEIFEQLKTTCSEHNSLLAVSKLTKPVAKYDSYFCKTLIEEYYSKTLCKKNVTSIEVMKMKKLLQKMEKYKLRVQKIDQCKILLEQ